MTDALTTVILTFRDSIRRYSPPWLQRGLGEKILYAIGLHGDIFGDALVAGVKQRFPGLYSGESLSALGRERRIPRGRIEDDAGYGVRLRGFFRSHAQRGGPYELLRQLYYYYAPAVFRIDLAYYTGRHFVLNPETLAAGGTLEDAIERSRFDWKPDTETAKWARWWLIYSTDVWADDPPTADELAELRFVPRQWNAAHPIGTILLVASTSEMWNWPLGRTWNESGRWNPVGKVWRVEVDADTGATPGRITP